MVDNGVYLVLRGKEIMSKSIRSYGEKRAEAIRELKHYRNRLLSSKCSVDTINRAFRLKKLYNL